jgi:phosphatidate cytidylyltransferase
LKKRIATAAVLIPLTLLIVGYTNPLPISIAAIALAAIGVYELAGMFRLPRVLPVLTLGSLAMPFYAVYALRARQFAELLVLAPILFALAVAFLAYNTKKGKVSSSVIDFGGLWISMPLLALLALHDLYTHLHVTRVWNFATPTLLALVPVWAGDIAAIFAGKAFGKHPLSKASPNKTIEGSIANLIAAVLAAWGIGVLIKSPLPIALTCGIIAGTFGQWGDLYESALKRRAGVKDSGRLFPGHGGVLDRIDSVLFAAIPIALVVYFGPVALHKLHGGRQDSGPAKGIYDDKAGARIVGGH